MFNQLSCIVLLVLCKICFSGNGNVNAMDHNNNYYYDNNNANESNEFDNNAESTPSQIFKGNIKIRKIDSEGSPKYKPAKKVCIELFCGTNHINNGIFTDEKGYFEEILSDEQIKKLKNCKFSIHIGFYKQSKTILKKCLFVRNEDLIMKIFAKLTELSCLMFFKKGASEEINNFIIDLTSTPKYANINKADAKQIIDENDLDFSAQKSRIFRHNFQKEENSSEEASSSEASSNKKKVKQFRKDINSQLSKLNLFGSKDSDEKRRKKLEQYKTKLSKTPHVFDYFEDDSS